jgi:hypothetical protein
MACALLSTKRGTAEPTPLHELFKREENNQTKLQAQSKSNKKN